MQQRLPHDLWRKSNLTLMASPICRSRIPNASYSLLNSLHSVQPDRSSTSFRLTYTAPLLYTLPPLQTARTNVSPSQNTQTTSIRETNSYDGGRDGMIIHNSRTSTTTFTTNAFSSNLRPMRSHSI